MKIKLIIISVVGLILSGCTFLHPHSIDPNAKSRAVKIVAKEPFTTFGGSAINGFNNTVYTVQDGQGRKYTVYSTLDTYKVNECMTLWLSKNMLNYNQYPRLTPTGANCKTIKPEQDVGDKYIYGTNAMTSSQFYDLALDAWIGESVNTLVNMWGAPDKQFSASGVNYIGYTHDKSDVNTNYDWLGNAHVASSNSNCQTTFAVKNNVVTSYKWKGNDCLKLLPK